MAENSENQSSISESSPLNSSTNDSLKLPQVPNVPPLQQGGINMLPIMYPALVPGFASAQNQDQMNRGPGIYAVPVVSYMGTVTGIPNTLIPLTYSTPTTRSATSEAGAAGEQNQVGPQQLPPHGQIVVRRFQIAFQLDLLLILKLAAVIFIFNQDGSRQRLAVLVFFGIIVYLYQTGALTPLVQWVSQAMQRAAAPPRPPRPAPARVEPLVGQEGENIAADGQPEVVNGNQLADDANRGDENDGVPPEAEVQEGNHWWGIAKEIQMIVFGFITSLLPGFHNMDHP